LKTTEVYDLAYGGNGVGRDSNGKIVFLPYTVPGDFVSYEVTAHKSSYFIGRIVEVLKPSPLRIEPICPHFGECGGCHYMHINYQAQLAIKCKQIDNCVSKIWDKLSTEILPSIFPGFRIRAVIRTSTGSLGFYKTSSRQFVPIQTCKALSESLSARLQEWLPKAGDRSLSVSVIETPNKDCLALIYGNLNCGSQAPFSGIKTGTTVLGKDHILYATANGDIPTSFGLFFQANRYMMDNFQNYAADLAEGNTLELYAGSGFFTSAIKKRTMVLAVENNPIAVKLAQDYGYPMTLDNAGTFLAKCKTGKFDTIFLDPPRLGLDSTVIKELLRLNPSKIVHVSCNPTTLGRDLQKLSAKYTINKITAFDLFPYTYHVECVAECIAK
jgi:23S rRNA (uracil1939-C5)-methyltransferase